MAAANRSPLSFGIILAFHLCVLASGVLLQNLWLYGSSVAFGVSLGVGLAVAVFGCIAGRHFLWDVFRSFKSAAVLLLLLSGSCVLGTLFIQDLDLRRAGVFRDGKAEGVEGREAYPSFVLDPAGAREFHDTKSGRFAMAQSFGLLKVFPTEKMEERLEEDVRLLPHEEARAEKMAHVFGETAAGAWREAVVNSKRREVERRMSEAYAKRNFVSKKWAREHIPDAEKLDVGWTEHFGLYDVWSWTRRLHLFDIFESWWFYFLLGLIGVNVVVGTFARAPWNLRDFGIVVTHSGIIIILSGALVDRIVAKEGYIHFTYGKPGQETATRIKDEKTRTYSHLPFLVRLDRFATEYYHELLVEVVDWDRNATGGPRKGREEGVFFVQRSFPVREGVTTEILDGQVEMEVLAYEPRVFVQTDVVEAQPGAPDFPAARLGLYTSPTSDRNLFLTRSAEPWVFALDPRRSFLEYQDSRFELRWAEDEEEYRRLLAAPPLPDNGFLVVRQADGRTRRLRVMLGETRTVQVGGRPVQLAFKAIRSALDQEQNVNLDRKLQRREEPWLYVEVNGTAVGIPRDPDAFVSAPRVLEGAEFRFDWNNPRDNGVRRIYRVVAAEDRPAMLVQAGEDAGVRAEQLRPRARLALHGLPGFLELQGLVRAAREKRAPRVVGDAEFLREGGDPARDEALAAWMKIRVSGPWGSEVRELTPFDPPLRYGDDGEGRPYIFLQLVKTKQARDWFSVLSAVDENGEVQKTHTVQVNSPLRYKGYRFFQATAGEDRDGFGVTGISVTYNPGVWYMYVGFLVLTLGTCWIFFFKPALDKRRRERRKQAREAAKAEEQEAVHA